MLITIYVILNLSRLTWENVGSYSLVFTLSELSLDFLVKPSKSTTPLSIGPYSPVTIFYTGSYTLANLISFSFISSKVHILYGGNDIFDYEVDKTLWADIRLSIFTMVFVAAFVLVFTRFSLWLTFWGILSLLTPICLAYFFFRVVFEKVSLGILSGISVFIIIGIGVDDVFVFINTFRQAHGAKNLETRIAHTLCTAGKATFFTSFTTAAAFSANCLSEVQI